MGLQRVPSSNPTADPTATPTDAATSSPTENPSATLRASRFESDHGADGESERPAESDRRRHGHPGRTGDVAD